jgi:hypothetical protein
MPFLSPVPVTPGGSRAPLEAGHPVGRLPDVRPEPARAHVPLTIVEIDPSGHAVDRSVVDP